MRLLLLLSCLLLSTALLKSQVYPYYIDSVNEVVMSGKEVKAPHSKALGIPTKTVYKGIRSIVPGKTRVESEGILRSTHLPAEYIFYQWMENHEQINDITVLALKV